MPNIPISPLDRDSGYFSFDLDAIPGGNPANAFPDRPRGSLTSVSDSYESTASSEATSPYEFQNLGKGSALKTPASALLVEVGKYYFDTFTSIRLMYSLFFSE